MNVGSHMTSSLGRSNNYSVFPSYLLHLKKMESVPKLNIKYKTGSECEMLHFLQGSVIKLFRHERLLKED